MPLPRLTVLRETLVKSMPTTVTVMDTDALSVDLVWMLEPPAKLPNPCWLLGIGNPMNVSSVADAFEGTATIEQEVLDESHVYTTGDTYTVLDQMDVGDILSVVGTRSGNPYTFIEGTDFQLADSNADGAKDALEWLAGGNKPDNGTAVVTDYTQKLLETSRSQLVMVEVYLHCVASAVPSGARGATADYRASEVIEAMVGRVKQLVEGTLRPALEAQSFTLDLKVDSDAPFKLKGTEIVQQQNVLRVYYQEDATVGAPVEIARTIAVDPADIDYFA